MVPTATLSRREGGFAEADEHTEAGEGEKNCRNVESTLPAEALGGLARDEVGQAKRDLIASADDANGVAAADDGNPVGGDADAGSPAERLTEAVGGPDKEQKVKAAAETEEDVEGSRAEHAEGQHYAW